MALTRITSVYNKYRTNRLINWQLSDCNRATYCNNKKQPEESKEKLINTVRIGIIHACELCWRPWMIPMGYHSSSWRIDAKGNSCIGEFILGLMKIQIYIWIFRHFRTLKWQLYLDASFKHKDQFILHIIPSLLMTWLHTSPGHHQRCYWVFPKYRGYSIGKVLCWPLDNTRI